MVEIPKEVEILKFEGINTCLHGWQVQMGRKRMSKIPHVDRMGKRTQVRPRK